MPAWEQTGNPSKSQKPWEGPTGNSRGTNRRLSASLAGATAFPAAAAAPRARGTPRLKPARN